MTTTEQYMQMLREHYNAQVDPELDAKILTWVRMRVQAAHTGIGTCRNVDRLGHCEEEHDLNRANSPLARLRRTQ